MAYRQVIEHQIQVVFIINVYSILVELYQESTMHTGGLFQIQVLVLIVSYSKKWGIRFVALKTN